VLERLVGIAGRLARGLLVLLVFAASAYLAFSFWVRRGVTPVPEALALPESEARELLTEHGLAPRAADSGRYDPVVPAGGVVETRPRSGSLVKRGSEVELVLSLGPRRIVAPDLAGKSLAAARLTLEGEGLALGAALSVRSARGTAGTIVAQEPSPGVELPVESSIDVLVAQAASTPAWVMPDLVARRYEPARSALERQGFRFGNVAYEAYDGVPPGTILRQSPPAGHPLRRESAIGLVVATDATGPLGPLGPAGATP
jgi:serine/threonine-protein kinase